MIKSQDLKTALKEIQDFCSNNLDGKQYEIAMKMIRAEKLPETKKSHKEILAFLRYFKISARNKKNVYVSGTVLKKYERIKNAL